VASPVPRRYGAVNWRGLGALAGRGVRRFFKEAVETLGGPAVSSLLLLAVFALAAGGRAEMAPGLALTSFLAPGIVVFVLAHTAFEHAAVALLYDKLEGMIGDLLAAPLSPLELLVGYVLAALCNALLAGALVLGLAFLFVELAVHDLGALLGFVLAAALLFSLLGMLVGLWADRWEHYAMAESFLVLPLGFLSGTFFTLTSLPEAARPLIALNPVFYAVDGFRYALTGHAESALATGALLLAGLILLLWLLLWRLFAIGYKVKP
jgi:ABC-2 type transport system permease protein